MARTRSVPTPATPPGGVTRYRDRIFDDKRHDPYQARQKYSEPSACSDCGAIFHRGRWQWGEIPAGAASVVCPACQRTRDKLPAGTITLAGPFFEAHRDEVLASVSHVAERERNEHPLNRIMAIDKRADRTVVTTTDIHLPQRIAEALHHSYRGEFEVDYGHDDYAAHAKWQR